MSVRFYRNPAIVSKTPILTTALLEGANVFQLIRMWSEWTAAGQSLWAWCSVNLALILWLNFYLTFNREQKLTIYATAASIIFNFAVISTVVYFRYVVD